MIPKALGRRAIYAALKARQDAGISNGTPLCPFDFAVNHAVSVRFMAIPSMEGIYDRQARTIVISSLRPRGRRAFTCAHEYAHHVFGHGTHVDELPEDRQGVRSQGEVLADCFAGFLLMPRLAVLNGFRMRGMPPEKCTPVDAYKISCWLGVSYDAFLTHASLAVRVMPSTVAESLKKCSPMSIKKQLSPACSTGDLIVVDRYWTTAVDLVVGDHAMFPLDTTIDGDVVEAVDETADGVCFRATARGIGRAFLGQMALNVRVMPTEYTGLARCRHIPEDDNV